MSVLNLPKVALVLLFLLSQAAWAASPVPGYNLTKESAEESPQDDIVIEHYVKDEDNQTTGSEFQEWLSEKANRKNRVLLFEHDHNVNIVFSPDENKLIINNHTGSTETIIHLFVKQNGLHYKEIKTPDLNLLLWRYFMQVNAPQQIRDIKTETYDDITPFDHSYLQCVQWSGDGNAILVRFHGHVNSNNHINYSWFCVLDLKTMTPSLDLNIMNRGAVILDGKICGDKPDTQSINEKK